jgi:hypothetical protein
VSIGRVILNWRRGSVLDVAVPCSICRQPTFVVSPRGTPCHKTCAEQWVEEHPAAVEGTGGEALGFRRWQR